MVELNRRQFLLGSAASATLPDPFLGTRGEPFAVGAPCLQAAGETTIGVSWKVGGLSKGVVEVADNPDLANARTFKSGGYGLVPIDVESLQVRLEGLKPGTRYWYRTVTTPFVDYQNIYNAKLGEPVASPIHSFVTMGERAKAHFCVINDTHAVWSSFEPTVAKVMALKPTVTIWNGDATNTTQKKREAVEIFLDPPIRSSDWSADVPTCFVSGNHDFRGSWISKKEEVVLPRHPAERRGDQWDLKWNFAFRIGEIALIGMDTGEDKPDGHPKWFGLANFTPYRIAQAKWLEEQLARPDIAAAKYKVLCCHIPLFAAKDSWSYPHDGVKIDPEDFAYWSRECHDLWVPIMEKAGVQLVIAAHEHLYRYDPPAADHPWAQVVGGGPKMDDSSPERFPTVIEGEVANGIFTLKVHDVKNGRIVAAFTERDFLIKK